MERVISSLRSTESKTRLIGVNHAEAYLNADGWEELLSALVSCLSDNNAKVAQGSLKMLSKLVANKTSEMIRPYFTIIWNPLKEKMGDSKMPAREAATELLLELIDKLGMSTVLERLRACVNHKNWRTREQALSSIVLAIDRFREDPSKMCLDGVMEMALKLLEDSSKEVREASISVLESLFHIRGSSLMSDLQTKHIRPTHMRMLLTRFGADELKSIPATKFSSTSPRTMSVHSSPPRSKTSSQAAPTVGVSSLASLSDCTAPISPQFPISCQYSERELTNELQIVSQGLANSSDWSKRVEAMQLLQRIIAGGGAQHSLFPPFLRHIRETMCEQLVDLRSSVTREACATITATAAAMGDSFNSYAEFFVASLLKATVVTIQVISVSADLCLKSIIQSTTTGYPKSIVKLIDGAKSRSQVLRLHCVEYMTLALTLWQPSSFEKYAESIAILLPSIITDAQGDVRQSARKCYWAYHRHFETRALSVYSNLDSSTQRRLQDDMSTIPTQSNQKKMETISISSQQSISSHSNRVTASTGPRRIETNNDTTQATIPSAGPTRVLSRKSQSAKPDDEISYKPPNGPLRVLSTTTLTTGTVAPHESALVGAKRVEKPSQNKPTQENTSIPSAKRTVLQNEEPISDTKDELSIQSIIEKTDDPTWFTRLEALGQLNSIIENNNGAALEISKWTKILQKRLVDSHYRVVASALKMTQLLLQKNPSFLSPPVVWKSIFPKIVLKTVDSKESVRSLASSLLDPYMEIIDPTALASLCGTTMLDGQPSKVKLVVFDCLGKLLTKASDFYQNNVLLRPLVLRLIQTIDLDGSPIHPILIDFVKKLYEIYNTTMSLIETQLPTSKINTLHKCFQSSIASLKRKPVCEPEQENEKQYKQDQVIEKSFIFPTNSEFDIFLSILSKNNNNSMEDKMIAIQNIIPLCKLNLNLIPIYFNRIIYGLFDIAIENDTNEYKFIQTKIIQTIKNLLKEFKSIALKQFNELILIFLNRSTINSLLAQYFIQKCLGYCLDIVDPILRIRTLIPLLQPKDDENRLQIILKALKKSFDEILSIEIFELNEFDSIILIILSCLNHLNSGVRKCSVLTIVTLYFLDEINCTKHFNTIEIYHQKLIDFYIKKEIIIRKKK